MNSNIYSGFEKSKVDFIIVCASKINEVESMDLEDFAKWLFLIIRCWNRE